MVEEHVHIAEAVVEGADVRPPEPKKYRYISKTSKIGGVDVTLYSIDGATWSSRKDELVNILERHEQERTAFGGELRGQTASMRYGKGMRRGHQRPGPKPEGEPTAPRETDEAEEPEILEAEGSESQGDLEPGAAGGDEELLDDDLSDEGTEDEDEEPGAHASKRRKAKPVGSKQSILDEIADEVDESIVGAQGRGGRGKNNSAPEHKAPEKQAKPEKLARAKAPVLKAGADAKEKSVAKEKTAKKVAKAAGKTPPPKVARKETPRAAARETKKPTKAAAKAVASKKRSGK